MYIERGGVSINHEKRSLTTVAARRRGWHRRGWDAGQVPWWYSDCVLNAQRGRQRLQLRHGGRHGTFLRTRHGDSCELSSPANRHSKRSSAQRNKGIYYTLYYTILYYTIPYISLYGVQCNVVKQRAVAYIVKCPSGCRTSQALHTYVVVARTRVRRRIGSPCCPAESSCHRGRRIWRQSRSQSIQSCAAAARRPLRLPRRMCGNRRRSTRGAGVGAPARSH